METIVILGIAVGLSMDCLAVAMSCGAKLKKPTILQTLRLASAFGLAQGTMPVVGWYAGRTVISIMQQFDHWLAFILLTIVGGKMIYEYFSSTTDEGTAKTSDPTVGFELLMLTIATSIDAMAVGLSLGVLNSGIASTSLIIGSTCFFITFFGVRIGVKASEMWGRRMELLGGIVLIAIGIKILAGHLAD